MQLQTIYKFYKEVANIKSKTGINGCGSKCRIPTTIVLESADYCANNQCQHLISHAFHVLCWRSVVWKALCIHCLLTRGLRPIQTVATLLRSTCCVRLHGTIVLALVSTCCVKFETGQTLAQQVPTFLLFCDWRSAEHLHRRIAIFFYQNAWLL